MWDSVNPSTALTRLTPSNDPNGLVNTVINTEPVAQIGTGAGSSPFDDIAPWNGMKIYTANAAGDIGNEVPRPVVNSIDDLVVRIPAFWFKIIKQGTLVYYYISENAKIGFKKHKGSDRYVARYATTGTAAAPTSRRGLNHVVSATRAAFRTGAANKGARWWQYDFNTYSALGLLMLVEFANWNTQSRIGDGVTTASAAIQSGSTDALTYHTGRPAGTSTLVGVQYRNIENLWGNIYQFVDGININNRVVFTNDNPATFQDDVTTGAYVPANATLPASGWITNMNNSDDENWTIPTGATGGSGSTFISDQMWSSATGLRVLLVGGAWPYELNAGFWCFNANNTAAFTAASVGSRLVVI